MCAIQTSFVWSLESYDLSTNQPNSFPPPPPPPPPPPSSSCFLVSSPEEEKMEVAEIAKSARRHAVMVRIQGPDPKGLKMRRHPFHLHQDGKTTLSASGLLLPDSMRADFRILEGIWDGRGSVVVTTAFVVEPFLAVRPNASESLGLPASQIVLPKLIMETSIDVLMDEGDGEGCCLSERDVNHRWIKAQLLALVEVQVSSNALQSLVTGPNSSWDIGWSLTPAVTSSWSTADNLQKEILPNLSNSSHLRSTSTMIALLGINAAGLKELPHVNMSQPQKRGDLLLVIGSPFGVLSPLHFSNSVCVGTVANYFPAGSPHRSLLMADVRGLPGMEGAPVFDKYGCLSGVLTRPIRRKVSGTEIQLVITWSSITNVCGAPLNEPYRDGRLHKSNNLHGPLKTLSSSSNAVEGSNKCLPMIPPLHTSVSPVERAIASVVLIAVGDGTWASGILLNTQGLIMTNAHLLDPQRFGKLSLFSEIEAQPVQSSSCNMFTKLIQESNGYEKKGTHPSASLVQNTDDYSSTMPRLQSYKRISVRLNNKKPWIWSEARVVYISKGPIDVALLQLEHIHKQLYPMTVDFTPPFSGLSIHIIGHGPFGPQSDVYPYVSSGVITKVVRTPSSPQLSEYVMSKAGENLPIMLQTTAAVYPGMSGGAVVNSYGQMIGLVTSNARHNGGAIIPEMNFSLPTAALEPIFKFSVEQDFSILQAFDRENAVISSVWSLKPLPASVQQSPSERKYDNGKGMRFAEFLAKKTPFMDQEHRDNKLRNMQNSKL